MPPLFPPHYPYRPDAPLLSFGPSFSEEIARSVIAAVRSENDEQPHEAEVQVAASLTMLEAFHPRDHLECMMAAHSVGLHAAMMDSLGRAMRPDMSDALVIKYRANAAQMHRGFSLSVRDLERRQTKPLLERPDPEPSDPPPEPAPPSRDPPRTDTPPAQTTPEQPEPALPSCDELLTLLDEPRDLPEDAETRLDGTPGTLAAYAPRAPEHVYIPGEPAIMIALATRGKPWRLVNQPADPSCPQADPPEDANPAAQSARPPTRGPLDQTEKMFTGDALARFASTRFDPDAPIDLPCFDHEDSIVELELISTGGDPEAEAERAAMIAAHPEGKPIVTFRYGNKKPPDGKADDG